MSVSFINCICVFVVLDCFLMCIFYFLYCFKYVLNITVHEGLALNVLSSLNKYQRNDLSKSYTVPFNMAIQENESGFIDAFPAIAQGIRTEPVLTRLMR